MRSPVFISYSSKDVLLANKIVDFLEGQGYPCWIAPRNITTGKDYTDMINDAILQCRMVVLIVSTKSLKSQWVKKEISTAVSYNKTILPYRISNVEITGGWQFLLNNVQWIDASSNPYGQFQDLVDGLEQRLSTTSSTLKTTGKKSKMPLIIGLSVSALALVGGGLFIWHGSSNVADSLPSVVDTASVETVAPDTVVSVPQPFEENPVTEQKGKSKEQPKAVTKAKLQKPVEESVTEEKTTSVVVSPDTAGQAQARQDAANEQAFQKKLRMAKSLYIDHNYREALTLFEELRREKPLDKEINAYIKDCRKMMSL